MNFKFEVYESKTMEDFGTVAEVVGNGGTLRLLQKNLDGTKNVAVILKNSKGETVIMPCSSPVSEKIRSALKTKSMDTVLSAVASLKVLGGTNKAGLPIDIICAPAGVSGLEEFEIEALVAKPVTYAELVAF